MKALPLNIQSFPELIRLGRIYVDKTALIYKLARFKDNYFLSRPRRFGKSLLCSTLKAYFEGRRELFAGLAIESLETEWQSYPVMHVDFNANNYSEGIHILNDFLHNRINEFADTYGVTLSYANLGERFVEMLKKVHQATGRQVVLIFDEYDKPLLETMLQSELNEATRNVMRTFYGSLKTSSDDIRFEFMTGVTKFSRLSIFSDLNNITDISLDPRYATLLGITDSELHNCFTEHIGEFAAMNGISVDETYDQLKRMYDGYHFSWPSEGVYNPYSVLHCLNSGELESFWSETSVPKFLADQLQTGNYDLTALNGNVITDKQNLSCMEAHGTPIGMMYQSGYITIKGADRRTNTFQLGFPNNEVRQSFLKYLIPQYIKKRDFAYSNDYHQLFYEVEDGDVDAVMATLRRILAGVPCETTDPDLLELHYRNIIYLAMNISGHRVSCERAMLGGVIDLVVETDALVMVFEFKRGDALRAAADQIVRRQYAAPWLGGERRVIAVAVALDEATRNIASWQQVAL